MRKATRLRSGQVASLAAAIALITTTGAEAHPERTTTYPDPNVGSVPSYRTSGPSNVVCKSDSGARIRRIFRQHGSKPRRPAKPRPTRVRRLQRARTKRYRIRMSRHRSRVRRWNRSNRDRLVRLRVLKRCRFRHIQEAIDAARNDYRILVLPGVYREEPSRANPLDDPRCREDFEQTDDGDPPLATFEHQRKCPNARNLIAIIGDQDGDGRCDSKCGLQLEGLGRLAKDVLIVGDRLKKDVIRADRADGITIRNLTAEQAAFNNVDVVETNGFRLERLVTRYGLAYGVLTYTSDHGLYDRIEAYGNGDSGIYPGSGPEGHCKRYGIEVRRVNSYGNTVGYSGTAGNGTWVHDSRFHHNGVGLGTDSAVPGHPGMPQDCSKYEHNEIYSNNLNLYGEDRAAYCSKTPFERRDRKIVCPEFLWPVGTGIAFFGANENRIAGNHIWDNWRTGIRLNFTPAAVRGEPDPAKQYDTSHGNRFIDNRLGLTPQGSRDPNGLDFYWDEEGERNCWSGNVGLSGGTPTSNPGRLPTCPEGSAFGLGNPMAGLDILPCQTWDPKDNPHPAGCDWYTSPPKPK